MRVFVTGGTGLVGSHVIEHLRAAGHEVIALVRNETGASLVASLGATPVHGRVEEEQSWSAAYGADAIVHSAALILQQQPWEVFQTINVEAAKRAAVTAARLGAKLIHVSSVAVYGRRSRPLAGTVDEDAPWTDLAPRDYYARSKRLAEEAVWSVADETGLRAVALRPCVIYGERDRTFLPRVIKVLRFGVAPLIGKGDNILTAVYAGNVAEVAVAALEYPDSAGSFNVANDGEITQRDFLAAVGEAMGRRPRLVTVPVAAASAFVASYHLLRRLTLPGRYAGIGGGATRFMTADNPYLSDRARRALGWTPSTPPAEAVRRSVQWFLKQN
jgi:nucleoside-diphosphate-sugar epimerase